MKLPSVTEWLKKNNHGYVRENPDGLKARCGGPAFCSVCQAEGLLLELMKTNAKQKEEINKSHSRPTINHY